MNPGWDGFVRDVLPRVQRLPCPFVLNVAGKSNAEFVELTRRAEELEGVAGLELNLSCPNVAQGLDFSKTPAQAARVVEECRAVTSLPLLAKLSPNVDDIVPIAMACESAGADGLSLINTYLGTAIDWRTRRSVFARGVAGLSGPAIKPLALLAVLRTAPHVSIPIVGIGGIAKPTDVLEFLIAGATAVQVGTACFVDPFLWSGLLDGIRDYLRRHGLGRVADIVGTVDRSVGVGEPSGA
jgi:dihydroorotate dehydrogenase (NAD+) catalytic subunit